MKKIKHDHKGTKLLKLGIFASMMIAPLLAIAFKCAYVTFNKNAKDSYSGETYKQYDTLNSIDDVSLNMRLHFDSTVTYDNDSNVYSSQFQVSNIDNIDTTASGLISNLPNAVYLNFYARVNNRQLYLYDANLTNIASYNITNISVQFDFTLVSYDDRYFNNTLKSFSEINIASYGYIDNAFYYAIDEMKNNELFNWTTNTALYTPTAAMTNGMGITTNALPILITYWLYLTSIYIVIDIVVELFTALTHMITSRFEQ